MDGWRERLRSWAAPVTVELRLGDPCDADYLALRGAEAVTLPPDDCPFFVLFRQPSPSHSAIVEEFCHVLQELRGAFVDRPLVELQLLREIEVGECLVANGPKLGIPDAETMHTAALVARYRGELRRLEEFRR